MPSNPKWISKFQIKPNSWVFVPTEESVKYGNEIKLSIENRWSVPDNYFHLKEGGHVQALRSHIKNQFFIHLDIRDFYGCVNRSRVTRCLKEFFGYTVARDIAVASTVKLPESSATKYILPFGFVQSPIIASLCLYKSGLNKYLSNLRKQVVSVYMDDIIISGNDIELLQKILEEVKIEAHKSRFTLNPDKEEGPSKKITAFNIELSQGMLTISDGRFIHFCDAYNLSESENQRKGIVGYVSSVNPDQAKHFS